MNAIPGPGLPAGWEQLSPLLDQLLDAQSDQRDGLLDRFTEHDASERARLVGYLQECLSEFPLLERGALEQFDTLLDEADPLLPPDLLDGRYRLDRELGHGGMAVVYLATDQRLHQLVAVKVIRPGLVASLGRSRFLREIAIAARIRHPNIVPLLAAGEAEGVLYFVMPFLPGATLRDGLGAGKVMTIAETIRILRDVARALVHAHANGVVHRDIKPDNVLVADGMAVVTDFGIAKAMLDSLPPDSSGPITLVGTPLGTPAYMSPEQALGDPSIDHRTDLYSFGCLGYELLTGRLPFDLGNDGAATRFVAIPALVSAYRSEVPEAIVTLIASCLQPRPADRPADAKTLLKILEGEVSGAI